MQVLELEVDGYRSLQNIHLPLSQVNIITGANGCGKSNLYKAMYLMSCAATGNLAHALALEGGMPSALWAGERKNITRTKKAVRMRLCVKTEEYNYEIACGLPPGIPPSQFDLDPEVKEEYLWHGHQRRKSTTILERKAGTTWVCNDKNERIVYPMALSQSESVLSQLHEPHLYPELSILREKMRQWRFYHHFRTDLESPLRFPQIGVRSPILANDGANLAAALQTIIEIGDEEGLYQAIEEAFPGTTLQIHSERTRFEVLLQRSGIKRPFEARELSDGTLRYLCLIAALLSPRPPEFLALNEPEMSLHPDLMQPLAKLIVKASRLSQIWVTSHSELLVKHLEKLTKEPAVILKNDWGYTEICDE